jgi:hypothetical protein
MASCKPSDLGAHFEPQPDNSTSRRRSAQVAVAADVATRVQSTQWSWWQTMSKVGESFQKKMPESMIKKSLSVLRAEHLSIGCYLAQLVIKKGIILLTLW